MHMPQKRQYSTCILYAVTTFLPSFVLFSDSTVMTWFGHACSHNPQAMHLVTS